MSDTNESYRPELTHDEALKMAIELLRGEEVSFDFFTKEEVADKLEKKRRTMKG